MSKKGLRIKKEKKGRNYRENIRYERSERRKGYIYEMEKEADGFLLMMVMYSCCCSRKFMNQIIFIKI